MDGPMRVIVLDRYPEGDDEGWDRLVRDVVGGGSASSALIAALDRPAEALLDGIDVEAAMAAAEDGTVPFSAGDALSDDAMATGQLSSAGPAR